MFCMLKKKKYILLTFQKITQIVKKFMLLMIPNGKKREAKSEGQRWHYLPEKKLPALLRGIK